MRTCGTSERNHFRTYCGSEGLYLFGAVEFPIRENAWIHKSKTPGRMLRSFYYVKMCREIGKYFYPGIHILEKFCIIAGEQQTIGIVYVFDGGKA